MYRIDKVEYTKTPMSKFKDFKSGNEITLIEYYFKRYQLQINSTN